MIQLTRLNRQPIIVNSDLIQFVENAPDTVITLVSGEKIVVLETVQAVIDRIIEFRRRIPAAEATARAGAAAFMATGDLPEDR